MVSLAVGAAALVAAPLAFGGKALARNRVETPRYEVEATYEGFEVRRYAPRIVAEVTVSGSPRQATNQGFRILANFIFGANAASESVEMTAPVDRRRGGSEIAMTAPVDRRAEGEQWVVTFTMPAAYTLESLPRPLDERIRIRVLEPSRYVVSRFSGAPGEKVWAERSVALRRAAAAAGYALADAEPIYARYDPPWTPSFLRRNEILLPLEPEA